MVKLKPIERPFICGDLSLSLPTKQSTISAKAMYFWTLIIPTIIVNIHTFFRKHLIVFKHYLQILVCELLCNRLNTENMKENFVASWINLSRVFRRYLINYSLIHIFMVVTKLFTGSHRPHFFDACIPDKLANCTANTYVYEYKCTNTEIKGFYMRDLSMSFMSGHSLMFAYSCCFLILYLHYRLRARSLTLWLPFVQAAIISLAFFGSISRIIDNKHHVIDVTVGALVGILAAIHIWLSQCKTLNFNDESDAEKRFSIDDSSDQILPINTANK